MRRPGTLRPTYAGWPAWTGALVAALLGLAGLASGSPAAGEGVGAPADSQEWIVGSWQGVRRDGADGTTAPLTLTVEPILGNAGYAEHLEVRHDGGVYRGFSTQVFDPESGGWVRMYVNATRRHFVRLEGEVADGTLVWRSMAPDRPRETRVVWERPAPDRWRRTSSVSEDGGTTWRVLFVDELERSGPAG